MRRSRPNDRRRTAVATLLAALAGAVLAGCARERWPDPPAVDRANYRAEYDGWMEEQRQTIAYALPLVGIWSIEPGETPFGADAALPIALPASAGVPRAGAFRRTGDTLTVVPAPGAGLRWVDGGPIVGEGPVERSIALGSLQLEAGGGDGRYFVIGRDEAHPAARSAPPPQAYEIDPRWRVSARFDAFDAPKMVTIADVRGGTSEMPAAGQLLFRVDGREMRLTALGPGEGTFFVMFKDPTNGKTTYSGYRILSPRAVKNGEWTVLDFNFAHNPPCAYSRFTVCPLPPRENTLDIAVEAGLKKLPDVEGWVAG